MSDLMQSVPKMKKWKEEAEESTFFGFKIGDLSRDELLGVIGWFNEDCQKMRESHEEESRFYRDLISVQTR